MKVDANFRYGIGATRASVRRTPNTVVIVVGRYYDEVKITLDHADALRLRDAIDKAFREGSTDATAEQRGETQPADHSGKE